MPKKEKQNLTLESIDKLLAQQTVVILNAVDDKLEKGKKEIKKEINNLRISIDKFVGLYTKQEQEFTIMKEHLRSLETRITQLEAKIT